MSSSVRAVNAMRNTVGGDVMLDGQDQMIIPLTIRDCSTDDVLVGSIFRFKVNVNTVFVATTDLDPFATYRHPTFRNGIQKTPAQSNEGIQRFVQGICTNTYADFRLNVAWASGGRWGAVDRCLIVLPHKWYAEYCSEHSESWKDT